MGARQLQIPLRRLDRNCWEVPAHGGMRVPGRIFADERLLAQIAQDAALQQMVNVAHMPGIVGYSFAMPDIHAGYGFPIGGVAAMDPSSDGVVSPGGVGYDINCGVRLARTNIRHDDVKERIGELIRALYAAVPCGLGVAGGIGRVAKPELRRVLRDGAIWAVRHGLGTADDIEATEDGGAAAGADPSAVSERAIERGHEQLGSLGSGNHFLELQVVDQILLPDAAASLGLVPGNLTVMIHSGSRGLGHQVCTDALQEMGRAAARYKLHLPDRQLAAAPINSPEGQRYLGAMFAAANFAWCNRQVLMQLAADALAGALGSSRQDIGFELVYDVAHNIAKFEQHLLDGQKRLLLVHRKGATRAALLDDSGLAQRFRDHGQPVLIPGDMGRYSFVCAGSRASLDLTFGSSCHGAGRQLSRSEARRQARGRDLFGELRQRGVEVMAEGRQTVAEEMPDAYKDVAQVVAVMRDTGAVRPVARLRPLAVVKG
ncbi:MAG: RtcB family protein [Deltaproteobacteria bacterium]|nr:RtcB family protein [Deltaproteobacteria bacterium]